MRVALLTNNQLPPREGIGRHVIELAKRLPAHGGEPIVLAKGPRLRGWQRLEVEGVPVALYPYAPVRPFHQEAIRLVLQPWFEAGAEGAELLHLHLPLLPRLPTGLPRVVTFHSPLLADVAAIHEPGLMSAMIKANARLFGQAHEQAQIVGSAAIVAVSRNVADELTCHYRLGGRRPVVIPNGVDVDFFARSGHARRSSHAPRTILYVGRLGYRKGLSRLLDAAALLRDLPDWRLALAGEGPLESMLRAQAQALGIGGRVEFLGFLDRTALRDLLHRSAVLVNPADYESGPLTLLEGMAAGIPVVTTPTGIARDLGAAAPAVLCEPEPKALAAAIRSVLDDASGVAHTDAARRLVRDHFAWENVVAKTVALYRSLARQAA
jgi:glycosyltransferase involved in cell wall biosynthesis